MAGIMIYIPGGGGKEKFAELGLASLLEPHVGVLPFAVAQGPDGDGGSLIMFDNPFHPVATPKAYDAATQAWRPAARDGDLEAMRYWVGYVTDSRPRPEELQRRTLYDGEPVELDDRQVWVVPIADYLPQRMTRDCATGEQITEPKTEHREFVELANAVYEDFLGDGFTAALKQQRVVIPEGYRLAQLALVKNYRINADVIDLLGLVDEIAAVNVALAATGVSLAGRVLSQKKSEDLSQSSS